MASLPVDVAGFLGHKKVVKVFIEHIAARIDEKTNRNENLLDLDKKIRKPVFDCGKEL